MSVCEELGPLISSMIDDELSSDETERVEQHLATCANCRRRAQVFVELDQLAATEVPTLARECRGKLRQRVQAGRQKQRLSWVAAGVAAAAVLLAMVGTALQIRRAQPRPGAVSTEPAVVQRQQQAPAVEDRDLTGPLETLQVVSRQEQRTHDAMRQLMGWDLRALKLELKQLELPSDQIDNLERRIDHLIDRVEHAGMGTNATGESI